MHLEALISYNITQNSSAKYSTDVSVTALHSHCLVKPGVRESYQLSQQPCGPVCSTDISCVRCAIREQNATVAVSKIYIMINA